MSLFTKFYPTARFRGIVYTMLAALYVITVLFVVDALAMLYTSQEAAEHKTNIRSQVIAAKSELEAAMFHDTYVADSLATVITLAPDITVENWTAIAQRLIDKSYFARNVGIAPNDIIDRVYPIKGNEKAIGFDFRTRPEQYKTVLQARNSQSMVISGPVNLVQGGKGLIARFPIFEDYPQNNQYWGTVSVVMNYDTLMEHAGFDAIKGANIALRGKDGEGADGAIFEGKESLFSNPDETFSISLPQGSWQLALSYDLSAFASIQTSRRIIYITGLTVALLLLLSVAFLLRAYAIAHQSAMHDELTGLPNRRYLMNQLQQLMKKSGQPSRFTLVNLDLNGFKQVNDTFGHDAGDELLKLVALAMQRCLRTSDLVARIGGDEFVLILNRLSDGQHIHRVLEKLKQEIADAELNWHGHVIKPRVSIGFAVFTGQDTSIKELMAAADAQMYSEKRASKVTRLPNSSPRS